MKQYLDLVAHVIKNGTLQANRTGVKAISFPCAQLDEMALPPCHFVDNANLVSFSFWA